MSKKILFIDTVHSILKQRLSVLKYQCEFDLKSSKEEIENKIEHYSGLVIRSRIPIDKQFLDKATHLKFIARSGAGLENIDVDYAKEKGIKVFNSPEGNKDAVGEHAIGMLLMLFNQLKKGDKEVRNRTWDREGNRGLELSGKTVGIIGYGNMGSALAKKLSSFDCKIIAYDKYKSNFGNAFVTEVDLATIFRETDILSIHLPLSKETNHYINNAFINQFNKPIYIINTARGNHIVTKDLVKNIKSGKVLGSCLDVLEYEAPSFEVINAEQFSTDFQYLTKSEEVILSPHVAGWTEESYLKLANYLAEKIEKEFG